MFGQMKNSLGVCAVLAAVHCQAQVTMYQETFDGVHNWTLNVPTGVNGADNNFWTVSSAEAGVVVGGCATTGGTDRTLHVTSVFNPSGGADYDTGGLCGILFCPQTARRAESPAFSTVGQDIVVLSFEFIANGQDLVDNASVVYDIGNGWIPVLDSIKSDLCGPGQGRWTSSVVALPNDAANQPLVRVGINWTNNDDSQGTRPSVAINNVRIIGIPPEIFANGFE
jgi:hypothetical protein